MTNEQVFKDTVLLAKRCSVEIFIDYKHGTVDIKSSRNSVFMQGDDATSFIRLVEEFENRKPLLPTADILLYIAYDYIS